MSKVGLKRGLQIVLGALGLRSAKFYQNFPERVLFPVKELVNLAWFVVIGMVIAHPTTRKVLLLKLPLVQSFGTVNPVTHSFP